MSDAARGATTFRVSANARQAEAELAKFQNRINDLEGTVRRLNERLARTRPVNFDRQNRQLRRATQETERFNSSLGRVGSAFATFTALSVGLSFTAGIRSLVRLGAVAESTRVRFLALSETIQEGRDNYQRFAEFADSRGLRFQGLVEAANQLRVVGFGGEDLIELIEQIGIIAGDSTERVERITRALGQMRAFGRVALEELNQLTEAGVPIIAGIADQLDIPEGRVRGLIELGEIDFETVRAAFRDLSSESSAFFIASEAQSETLQASFNRLRNAIFLFSDEINERTSPALIGLVESAANIVDFFATTEGSVIGISTLVNLALIPAIGLLLTTVARFTHGTLDPLLIRLQLIRTGFARAAVGAGLFRRAMLQLQLAIRTAFTGPVGIITTLAIVTMPLLISRFERLRQEAQLFGDILEGYDAGQIVVLEDEEQIDTAASRLRDLERELSRAGREVENLQRRWNEITETIRSGNDETGAAALEQEGLASRLSVVSEEYADLTRQIDAFRRAVGEEGLPPLAVELPEVEFPDEVTNRIRAQTDALSEDILGRLQERLELTDLRIAFAPELEEQELRRVQGDLRSFINEVVEGAQEGLFFSPDGSTIAAITTAYDTVTERLAELRRLARETVTPLDELNKILEANALSLIQIDAAAQAGLSTQAEAAEDAETANRRTLQSLIVLLNTAGDISDDVRVQIQQAIDNFTAIVAPQTTQEPLLNDLFAPLFEEFEGGDILSRIGNVFNDVEQVVADRFREYLANLSRMRGVGEGQGLVDLFVSSEEDPSLIIQDQIREDTNRARLESLREFVANYEQESARFIQVSNSQALSFNEINQQQLRDYISFGNQIGVHASDLVNQLEESGAVDEEEAFRLHDLIGEQTDIIENETARANRALEDGFRVRITPQVTAIANAVLTLGEAFLSAGPAADNFFRLFEQGASTFDDPRAGIVATAEALATLVSIAEQPFLAIQDAVVAASDEYQSFLRFLELSAEDREAFLSLVPPDLADDVRAIIQDFNEVFSRVGTGFDADAFRVLPVAIQEVLEDAFNRYRQITPTLEEIYAEARSIVEDENITIANRIREIGSFLADNLGEAAIQYGTSVANIISLLTGGVQGLSDSFGVLREISGGLGEFLGLGRERVLSFVDAIDRFASGGNDIIILQERINETIGTATLGTVLNFNRLFTVSRSIEGSFEQAAFVSIRLNSAWREAGFVAGEFTGSLVELNEALNITELGLEDGAVALAGLAAAGGNFVGLIAPGVGLLAESVNNVIDSAADYVAVTRVINTLPTWFRQGDVDLIQRGARELDAFIDATQVAQQQIDLGQNIELPDIGPLAEEFQQVLTVLTSLQPFLTSDAFDEFLRLEGFPDLFPNEDINRGQQFLLLFSQLADGAQLTREQLEALSEVFPELAEALTRAAPDFFNQQLDNTIMIAREFSNTLSVLSETILNNSRVAVQEMRFQLDDLRDARRLAEEETNEQLERETEALRERLNAGLIGLEEYYSEVDAARAEAEASRTESAAAELRLLNSIQEAEYEAAVNAFNINKATRLADIAINAAASFAATVGQTGFFGIPLAGIVAGLAAAQAALVLAQQPPPKPPEITALQTGGVVSRPTNALIGEGGVPEAVIPLDRYEYRERGSSEGDNITVVVHVQGSVIEERRLAETLYRATREAKRVRRVPLRGA